jgi:hypothetical protein
MINFINYPCVVTLALPLKEPRRRSCTPPSAFLQLVCAVPMAAATAGDGVCKFLTHANASGWGWGTRDAATVFSCLEMWEAEMGGNLTSASSSWAATTLGMPVYLDESRRFALTKILPKISQLVRGNLKGQESCFFDPGTARHWEECVRPYDGSVGRGAHR